MQAVVRHGLRMLVRIGVLVGILASAVHIGWHLAHPGPARLSLGLAWHWLAAAPVFAGVQWYARRVWPHRTVVAVAG